MKKLNFLLGSSISSSVCFRPSIPALCLPSGRPANESEPALTFAKFAVSPNAIRSSLIINSFCCRRLFFFFSFSLIMPVIASHFGAKSPLAS